MTTDGKRKSGKRRTPASKNLFAVESRVPVDERWHRNGHKGGILWFTGLSGAGKTTLALELERQLVRHRYQAFVLDGDNIRGGLNEDLGFAPDDRIENIRRVGQVAGLFADSGQIVITAFISPYAADRDLARAVRPQDFHEIYVKADLAECERRDPKGLYKKARAGEIPQFTGIDAPYEPPKSAELIIDTSAESISESVYRLIDYVGRHFPFGAGAQALNAERIAIEIEERERILLAEVQQVSGLT